MVDKMAYLHELLYDFIIYTEMMSDREFYLETGFIIRDRDKLVEAFCYDYEDTISRLLLSEKVKSS